MLGGKTNASYFFTKFWGAIGPLYGKSSKISLSYWFIKPRVSFDFVILASGVGRMAWFPEHFATKRQKEEGKSVCT